MNLDENTRQVAKKLHKHNSRVMLPITLTAVAGVIFYVSMVFQGLTPPEGCYDFFFLAKIVICFICLGVPNVVIFEIWVGRELFRACRVLAWDGGPSLSQRDAIKSALELLDFPHRFIMRFLLHWIIGAPLIIIMLRLAFYSVPWILVVFLSAGTISIMALMATFHYFVIKNYYNDRLREALARLPSFFERREFARRRIQYRTKVLIYVLVLVGSMTWITAHISISGQARSAAYQRDRSIEQSLDDPTIGYLAGEIKARDAWGARVRANLPSELGKHNERVYLLDKQGRNRLRSKETDPDNNIRPLDRRIIKRLHQLESPASCFSGGYWAGAFKSLFSADGWKRFATDLVDWQKELMVHITDRVMLIYADGKEFMVTSVPVQDAGTLYTIQPQKSGKYLLQIGPIVAMFIIALILSWLFARSMHDEILRPVSAIISSSQKVESGDLSEPAPIMADDEVGELAVHHLRMISSIRAMVQQIGDAAGQVESATDVIAERTNQMKEGSESQSMRVDDTTASMTQMNQTISNIAESVETLASSAEESSASIVEMSATNDQVAKNAENLSESVEETTASIQELSSSVKQVNENVSDASGRTSDVAGSMREMSESVKEVDSIASESASLSEEVARDAEKGAKSVQSTKEGISQIREASQEVGEVITRLSQRAKEIGRILTVIDDVTEETNLLALNAAIIAAQAGEHGRGFAVVADEIKDLAERTQASTAEISEQIHSVQNETKQAVDAMQRGEGKVEEGVKRSEQADEALIKIQKSSRKSLEMAQKISESTKKQRKQAEEVLSFFEEASSLIDQVQSATQEQTKSSDQIQTLAEKMRGIAAEVKKATREQSQGGRQISQAIEHVSHIANYINNSQSEQKKAAQHVLSSMSEISDIAARNVEGVEKVSASVSDLKVLAEELKAMIEAFHLRLNNNSNQSEHGDK
ncbi:MAG: methyl-accepting chemotaxis protein [bacterium]